MAVVLAELPEIGTISNQGHRQARRPSPIANDSGQRQGLGPIRGGRASLRSILSLVADIARTFDPTLADFRQRLLDRAKPKMVVRIALARKRLVRRNAKARETRLGLAHDL